MVLDGANRSTAARAAGWPHLLVQVVRYESPAVQLSTWYHALTADARDALERRCRRIPGLTCQRRRPRCTRARCSRAARRSRAWCSTTDDAHRRSTAAATSHERNALLNAVVRPLPGPRCRTRGSRATRSSAGARASIPTCTALVVFPHFEPAEVLELASARRAPAGRHHAPPDPLARAARQRADRAARGHERGRSTRRTAGSRAGCAERLATRQVRFYEEPTVLFDE